MLSVMSLNAAPSTANSSSLVMAIRCEKSFAFSLCVASSSCSIGIVRRRIWFRLANVTTQNVQSTIRKNAQPKSRSGCRTSLRSSL